MSDVGKACRPLAGAVAFRLAVTPAAACGFEPPAMRRAAVLPSLIGTAVPPLFRPACPFATILGISANVRRAPCSSHSRSRERSAVQRIPIHLVLSQPIRDLAVDPAGFRQFACYHTALAEAAGDSQSGVPGKLRSLPANYSQP